MQLNTSTVYAKFKIDLEPIWKSTLSDLKNILIDIGNELVGKYKNQKSLQDAYSKWFRENKSQSGALDRYDVIHPKTQKPCKEPLMGYRFPESTTKKLLQEGEILFGNDHNKIIELKVCAKDYLEKLSSVEELDGRLGAYDLRQLFPEIKKAFTNPKPIALIVKYLSFVLDNSDVVLDFFSGSATTAHAVMQLNAEDGTNRKFILVQLPEPCDEKSEAFKAGYKTIAEIGKERIRRAGKKIKEENPETTQNLDIGFRVFKVDSSNMKDVYYTPDEVRQGQLALFTKNIKEDRGPEDLLFQVLLDWGLELTLSVVKETIEGKTVFFVDDNVLAACFDTGITEELVKRLASRKPLRAVFRDSSYGSDSVKINVEQIF